MWGRGAGSRIPSGSAWSGTRMPLTGWTEHRGELSRRGAKTFTFTGSEQTFTVPSGVTVLHVVTIGGRVGKAGEAGGDAAKVEGDPGEILYVEVGGDGGAGERVSPRGLQRVGPKGPEGAVAFPILGPRPAQPGYRPTPGRSSPAAVAATTAASVVEAAASMVAQEAAAGRR
jgi:hypothetical protein